MKVNNVEETKSRNTRRKYVDVLPSINLYGITIQEFLSTSKMD